MSVEYSIRVIATGTEWRDPCSSRTQAIATAKQIMAMAGYGDAVIGKWCRGIKPEDVAVAFMRRTADDYRAVLRITAHKRGRRCLA